MSAKNNVIDGMVDTKLISAFVEEWKASGMKGRGGKPDFCFECVGLKEGVKLYQSGSDKPIGEIAKRPLLVKTNRVIIYSLKKEFASLQDAEFAFCKSIGKSKKLGSCTGWRFFRVRFSKGSTVKDVTIRALWDFYPEIEKNLLLKIDEKPVAPAAKTSAKPSTAAKKLSEKDARIAELERQLEELSKKPTRIIKK